MPLSSAASIKPCVHWAPAPGEGVHSASRAGHQQDTFSSCRNRPHGACGSWSPWSTWKLSLQQGSLGQSSCRTAKPSGSACVSQGFPHASEHAMGTICLSDLGGGGGQVGKSCRAKDWGEISFRLLHQKWVARSQRTSSGRVPLHRESPSIALTSSLTLVSS